MSRLFEIRDFDYFQFGNTYTGSLEQFRYRIVPKDGVLTVSLWHGEQCFERAEIQKNREFPLTPQGLEEAVAYMEQQYRCCCMDDQ